MLTLLSPVALWSLTALALPLALHLWRQPPRTVPLPSLRFLQAQVGRKLRDLRWRERLLLLTRLGLLAALTLLLARPQWLRPAPRTPQRWILLDPTAAPAGSSLTRLHALQEAGYETHRLSSGLPLVSASSTDAAVPPDLWSLLSEADCLLPAGSTLAVFTPARLASLQGLRPALRAKIDWITTPGNTGTAPHAFIAAVSPVSPAASSPGAALGVSDAGAVRYTTSPPAGWKLETRPDAVRLRSPAGTTGPWTSVLTRTPLSVSIFHDADRAEDARYLAAAVRAALGAAARPLDLRSADTTPPPAVLPATDWTFWLSNSPPPPPARNHPTHLFCDAPHADLASPSWIIPQPGTPALTALTSPVRLWRRGAAPAGAVCWTDAQGAPLLTFTRSDSGSRWDFASRFHPAWTDLPRTTALPAWLQSLLLDDPRVAPPDDFRLADPAQAWPSDSAPASPATAPPLAARSAWDLHGLAWGLAALLFCLERALSHRRTPSRPAPASAPPLAPASAR